MADPAPDQPALQTVVSAPTPVQGAVIDKAEGSLEGDTRRANEGENEETADESLPRTLPDPDFITTHVLDQVAGVPAANLSATLTLVSLKSSAPSYIARTHPITGRISNWTPSTPKTAPMDQVLPILAVIKSQSPPGWKSVWSLRFDTGAYWEGQRKSRKQAAGGKGKGNEGVDELVATEETGEGGDATFYPEVEIKFYVDPEDPRMHWHVPVLLGPFGYTTYRGS